MANQDIFEALPEYASSSESEEANIASTSIKNRRKKIDKCWCKENVFYNKTAAEEAVKSETIWSYCHQNVDKEGNKNYYYRCNRVKSRGLQCQTGIYLHYPSHNTEIILYRSQLPHNCDHISTKSRTKISECTKMEIRSLFEFDFKIKPKKILEILGEKNLELPTIIEIKNFLYSLRKKKFGPYSISIGELEQFFIKNSAVPEDEKKAFIVSYEIQYNEPTYFRCLVSSKTLLKLSTNVKHIHVDATYKLIWQGYPVLIVGSTDTTRQFHPYGLSICSNEKTEDFIFLFSALKLAIEKIFGRELILTSLICDASHAIQNAFKRIFGEEKLIIMCWAHMKINVKKKAEQLVFPKSDVDKIIEDIDILQLSKTESIFEKASKLFLEKWHEKIEFVKYFNKEWLKCNRNWFEGISDKIPSTNNALESFNRIIKDENTLRERLPVGQFMTMLMIYIETWSNNYLVNVKAFNYDPKIDLSLWTEAYHWAKQDKIIITEMNSHHQIYFSPSKDERRFSEADLKKCKENDFDSFEQYKAVMFKIWTTLLPNKNEEWIKGKCDCPIYFKKRICKHIVGIAIRKKIAIPPIEAKTLPLGMKRCRGRPSKTKRALLMQ